MLNMRSAGLCEAVSPTSMILRHFIGAVLRIIPRQVDSPERAILAYRIEMIEPIRCRVEG